MPEGEVDVLPGTTTPINLVQSPGLAGAVVLAFEFGFVAEPGGVRAAGLAQGFNGERLEIGRMEAEVLAAEGGHMAGEGRFQVRADAAEAPLGVSHFTDIAEFAEAIGVEMFG